MSIDLDEIKKTINDKLSSPFFGPLILAFVACNWKGVLGMFYPQDNWDFFQRVEDIHCKFYSNGWHVFFFVYAIPLVVALFSATLLPHVLTEFDRIAHKAVVKRKLERAKQEAALPENVKVMIDLQNKNAALEDQLGRLRNEFQDLQKEEGRKSLGWAKTLQAIVRSDQAYLDVLRKLFRDTRSGLPASDKLNLLVQMDLVAPVGGGAFELTDIGRGVVRSIG